ncbi:hypothetical protein [Mycobacterium xenopi]|uniref:Uncharacterized protein n=2 Tax=Mycobacterium xenopi TaxID=1789 RepID=A0AAD1GWL5_MYCXE|nr:hypothetical protein [Mycobacterium xenopi]EUA24474.1 transposase, Mutator family protein [Mycobacterium xenopi 3993]EUA52156.1 transposase, Mutator family protein [Mycobacterium xenopi 4042]EUA78542.1 transposase, Mutator family protein [Mycobacterium xenopi 4042]MDA3642348.1 hypothetical protein [Mycobacterium xenopi]MDA3660401.1 hypothetical protein [Mycobacterium xenopi]
MAVDQSRATRGDLSWSRGTACEPGYEASLRGNMLPTSLLASESWADLLRDAKWRDMRTPVLAVETSTLGFWVALREAFLQAKEQRCWSYKAPHVVAMLPK